MEESRRFYHGELVEPFSRCSAPPMPLDGLGVMEETCLSIMVSSALSTALSLPMGCAEGPVEPFSLDAAHTSSPAQPPAVSPLPGRGLGRAGVLAMAPEKWLRAPEPMRSGYAHNVDR